MPVWMALAGDYMSESRHTLPHILANTRVLIYNGQFDLICNHLGTEEYLNSLKWPRQTEFIEAKRYPYTPNGGTAGYSKSAGPLTFLVVLGGSHMVPMDKPPQTLDMINRFMNNKQFNESATEYDMLAAEADETAASSTTPSIISASSIEGSTVAANIESSTSETSSTSMTRLVEVVIAFGAGGLLAYVAISFTKRDGYESLP